MKGSILPNARSAYVEERKVVDYLLNSDHVIGRFKAKYFVQRGFCREEWEALSDALRYHVAHNPVSREKTTPFATNYSVVCHLPTPDGTCPCIRSVWEVRAGDSSPRLITAHPLG